jgi:DNA-binding NtrC family response regulator
VGSTFNIYLPVALTAAQQEAEKVRVATVGGNETVLLVDDEAGIVSMAKEVLVAYGYRVIALLSPAEALMTAAEYPQRIDLLLSDVIMSGMNGKELSQQLTAQRPELRTLYMSGYTDNVLSSNFTLADGVAFLQKPFSVHALTTKVREVLDADR